MVLLLALLLAQALEPATAAGLTGAHRSGVQRAPWFNQAQNLQQQLSPVTGDMKKLESMSGLTTPGMGVGMEGSNPGLRPKRPGAHGAGGAPWAHQAQQLQSRLAGGASNGTNQAQQLQLRLAGGGANGSIDSLGSSLSGTSSTDSLASVPPPSAGGGISNPYAGGISVTSLGSAVPGANSPYTSTGNAAGLQPYGQALRYGLSGAE